MQEPPKAQPNQARKTPNSDLKIQKTPETTQEEKSSRVVVDIFPAVKLNYRPGGRSQ